MNLKAWLRDLGLSQYEQLFFDNAIDMDVLPRLTADDLKDIGVAAVGHRRKLLDAICLLRATQSDAPRKVAPSTAVFADSEGERRQVAVLFADLSSYSTLSNELDAEEIHALLGRFFETVDRIVGVHGGRVDKHIGDCVMAVFGAPVAHDNDVERCIRAALSVRNSMAELSIELGRPLRVHIGVATGQVVAGATGSSSYQEYTITGDTVNLASRLTELATADEIVISEPVRRALSDRLECREMGAVTVKGYAEPLPAWELQDLRSRRAEEQPFVGRRGELEQFRTALRTCQGSGKGQAICVRGEAGIGKTRLVEELRAAARDAGFACHMGMVLDFGAGVGDAIRAVVRDILGLDTYSRPDAVRAAAAKAAVDGLVQPEMSVFLTDLLDLSQPEELRPLYAAMDNATRNHGKRQTLAGLVERASRMQPRLVVVEDVHWADELVLGYLAELSTTIMECPALLVMTTRPEGDPFGRGWRARTDGVPLLTIDLGPLRPEEAQAFALSAFAADQRLAERCIERAAGNPLFLQQLLLQAEEGQQLRVPGSVQSLVQARLDRLVPADKGALQAASVLGQKFQPDAVAHVLDAPDCNLEPLVDHSLIRRRGQEFLFAHALICDAVYESLLKSRRRDLHLRAAAWFAGKDLLLHAEHLEKAEHPAAPRAYLEAARAQAGRYRYETAARLVERGLRLASERSERFALACFQGDMLHDLGDMAAARLAYQEALTSSSDDAQRCRALIGLAAVKRITDDLDGAYADLVEADKAATANGLIAERARIHFLWGNLCFPRGDTEGCLREHGKSLALARQAGDSDLEAAALGGLGDGEYMRGRMISAYDRLRACVDLCGRNGFRRLEVANHAQIAHAMLYMAPQQDALKEGLAAADAASRVGHLRAELNARLATVSALMALGRLEDCVDAAERAEGLVQRLGARRFDQHRLLYLGQAALAQGRRAEAVALLKRALQVARETGITFHGPTILGALALAVGDLEASRDLLAEAEAIIGSGCVGHNQLRFYPLAMQLALDLGDYGRVEGYAAALEDFMRAEPLPCAGFFIARARALAAACQGRRDPAQLAELEDLRKRGEWLGLETALPEIRLVLAQQA